MRTLDAAPESKRVLKSGVIIGVLFLCVMALQPSAFGAAVTLKFNHLFAPDSLENKGITTFAQRVADRTKGAFKIDVFPSGQLGDIQASFQALTLGTIDLYFVDITLIGYIKGQEAFFIGQVPYLFKTAESALKLYNTELFAPLYEKLSKEKGVRVLTVRGNRSPRLINTTKGPIFTPEDGNGIKIRVMPLPVSIKTFEAWGFKSTPFNWGELYMGMKQGIVEGQDNGLDTTVGNKMYEVAPYIAFTDHVYSVYGWYISEKAWQKVPTGQKKIFEDEAKAAGDMISSMRAKQEEEDLRTLMKAGVKMTVPNRLAFMEKSKDVYKEYEGKFWPAGLVEKIRSSQGQ